MGMVMRYILTQPFPGAETRARVVVAPFFWFGGSGGRRHTALLPLCAGVCATKVSAFGPVCLGREYAH